MRGTEEFGLRFLDEDEKRELRSHLKEYLVESGLATVEQISRGQNFSCPGLDHNDDSPSAHYYDDPKCPHVYCFGCGDSWELFKLIGEREGKFSFEEQVERARELYGRERSDNRPIPVVKLQQTVENGPVTEEEKEKLREFVKESQKHLEETDYFLRRGFSLEFAREQGVGYSPERHRLIVPTDEGYVARTVLPYDNIPRYLNSKGANVSLAGKAALDQDKPVFVVEGIFDALAIRQAGYEAISLNSTSNAKLLLDAVEKSEAKPELVIALDNDKTGRKTAMELKARLDEMLGVKSRLVLDSWGEFKDAGEWLEKAGNDALKERLGVVMAMDSDRLESLQDEETYAMMYHRLRENKPAHATDDLLEYWESVIHEIKETVIQLHKAEKQCKVLKLWSTAIEKAAEEFSIEPEKVEPLRQELSKIEAKAQQDLKDWEYIMKSMEKLDFFSNNLIDSIVEIRERNPLFKLPEVQHAMEAEEALREPPKQKPEVIYYALLREAAENNTGILDYEADRLIAERLKDSRKNEKEIAMCLSFSPALRNVPEGKRKATAETVLKDIESKRGAGR